MQEKYNGQITKLELELKHQAFVFNIVGYCKLALLLVFIGAIYLAFSNNFSAIYVSVIFICLIFFVLLWIYHSIVHEKINDFKCLIKINQQYIDRINGDWINFTDTGEELADKEHPYAFDLDLVGKKSLFQRINTTQTFHGRKEFANDLLNINYNKNAISERQEAVAELSKDIIFSNQIQYYASKTNSSDSIIRLLYDLNDDTVLIKSSIVRWMLIIFPAITIILLSAGVLFRIDSMRIIGLSGMFLQCAFWIISLAKTGKILGAASHLPYKLSDYANAFALLQSRDFKSKKLNEIKKRLVSSDLSAARAIKDLGKIANKINVKSNGVIYFVLNVLFLWDFECVFILEKWKEKYGRFSEQWFIAFGEFESLLSLSNLINICENTSFSVVSDEKKLLIAKEIGHPLIPDTIRIDNNINMQDSILIISGSNMSGKTTFLRTLGINLVLAQAGGTVCARYMTHSLFQIMTSMRIADDLSEGISTFYAELRRIKNILDSAEKNKNTIFLIDEIFRGTNSGDRLYGAKTVISKLCTLGVTGLITTHDLELCALASDNARIQNYNFSEYFENNKIYFDYKIKTGKSKTTNAKYLMEIIGIK